MQVIGYSRVSTEDQARDGVSRVIFRGGRKKPRGMPRVPKTKAAVLQRLRTMQAEVLSLQAMANRFNTKGGPTLSGKGRWRKSTIGNLLAQTEDQ